MTSSKHCGKEKLQGLSVSASLSRARSPPLLVHCVALARSVRAHCAVVVSDKHLMVEEKDRDGSVPVFVLLFKERERPPPPLPWPSGSN